MTHAHAGQIPLFHSPRAVLDVDAMTRYCRDCAVDVGAIGEWFMVTDDVWPLARDGGVLCVGCLECRIGRRLVARDFTAAPVNRWPGHSARLHARVEGRP